MKIKMTTSRSIVLPPLKLTRKLRQDMGNVLKGDVINNVVMQQQADGSPLRTNQPETRALKRRKGWTSQGRVLSLVAEKRRFTKPANWKLKLLKESIELHPGAKLRDLVGYVQEMGYTGWFGISETGEQAIRHVAREWLKDELTKARRKSRARR